MLLDLSAEAETGRCRSRIKQPAAATTPTPRTKHTQTVNPPNHRKQREAGLGGVARPPPCWFTGGIVVMVVALVGAFFGGFGGFFGCGERAGGVLGGVGSVGGWGSRKQALAPARGAVTCTAGAACRAGAACLGAGWGCGWGVSAVCVEQRAAGPLAWVWSGGLA